MRRTISETVFEKFCSEAGIRCVPVPREIGSKTPDYDLIFGELTVVVEVKEIDRNEEDRESDRLLGLRGYGNAVGGVPGQRVRQKIQSCSRQIKARAQGSHPGLLVLYEQHVGRNIEPYHIRAAMYGLETFILAVPESNPPYVIRKKLGPRQKMTLRDNTSISAVATLLQFQSGEIKLNIYHNKFSALPLPLSVLISFPVRQFCLGEPEPGTFPQWERVA